VDRSSFESFPSIVELGPSSLLLLIVVYLVEKYDAFHAKKEEEKGVVTMESGVQYKIIKHNKGKVVKPTEQSDLPFHFPV